MEKARQDLKTADAEVKLATKKYQDSKEACADQQSEIENLKIPLQRLNDEAKEQFGKVCIYDFKEPMPFIIFYRLPVTYIL